MKKSTVLLACLIAGFASQASAQTVSPAFNAWLKARRAPAQPEAPAPTPTPSVQQRQLAEPVASQSPAAPDTRPAQVDPAPAAAPVTTQPPAAIAAPTSGPVPIAPPPVQRRPREQPRNSSGAFIGVQAGKGWVYEDVAQTLYSVNAGYRWRAGAVSLIGIEAMAGKLDNTRHGDLPIANADFFGLGGTARFNFGRNSPWFAIARLGYWHGSTTVYEQRYAYPRGGLPYAYYHSYAETAYGAYAGFGIGVDLGRHTSLSLNYTGYVYSNSYDYDEYDPNYADTLNLGLEVRF